MNDAYDRVGNPLVSSYYCQLTEQLRKFEWRRFRSATISCGWLHASAQLGRYYLFPSGNDQRTRHFQISGSLPGNPMSRTAARPSIGGQQGFPEGLNESNKLRFAPRIGISHDLHKHGLVLHAAFGIFFTPVELNTWCNQRHNVPYVFPETEQSDNFIPAPGIVANHFNFRPAVLGVTTFSFAAFELNAPPQYIEQWSGSVEKSLGAETTLELGYLGSHGLHLQRSRLINNAPAGLGAIGPRRPFTTLSFLPGMVLPDNITIANTARRAPVVLINHDSGPPVLCGPESFSLKATTGEC